MKILYLDTSSKYLSLAIAEDNKVIRQTRKLLDRNHSSQLTPLIAKILKKAKLSLKQIDGFCISKGPGSFTGLRIGITCIKALAFCLRKPVVAIPSLDILAENIKKVKLKKDKIAALKICPIVDAKQHQVYACIYQAQNGKIKRKSDYLLLSFEQLLKKLKGKTVFLGDGIKVYSERISKNKSIKPFFAAERFWYPKASAAVSLAAERFRQGKFEDVNKLVPLYLYPKECQIKKVVGRR